MGLFASHTLQPLWRRKVATNARTSLSSSHTRTRAWLRLKTDPPGSDETVSVDRPSAHGSHNVTRVPSPSELTSCTVPPDCPAKPCTIDKPRPEPRPTSFVVKKGSKACASVASLIPAPVSVTVTTT